MENKMEKIENKSEKMESKMEEISWKIIDNYVNDNKHFLVNHHLDSYNEFFSNGIKNIFKENNPVRFLESIDKDKDTGKMTMKNQKPSWFYLLTTEKREQIEALSQTLSLPLTRIGFVRESTEAAIDLLDGQGQAVAASVAVNLLRSFDHFA
jgi:DNA-directed RNA polymerase beta subunit